MATHIIPQKGIAVAKFPESLLRVVPIMVLMPLMGFSWRSLYLQKGNIRFWLPVAIIAWIVFPCAGYRPLVGLGNSDTEDREPMGSGPVPCCRTLLDYLFHIRQHVDAFSALSGALTRTTHYLTGKLGCGMLSLFER